MDQLDARARELVTEGNRSRFVIQRGDKEIASLPLMAAAALGAVGLVVAPVGFVAPGSARPGQPDSARPSQSEVQRADRSSVPESKHSELTTRSQVGVFRVSGAR